MKFNSSKRIEDDYYESEDYYSLLDESERTIRLQKYLVRHSPVDDFKTEMDEVYSLAEFERNKELQSLVVEWLGEKVLQELLAKAHEISSND